MEKERPLEPEEPQYVNGHVTITFKIEDVAFDKKWSRDEIISYIENNPREFIDDIDEVVEVDI